MCAHISKTETGGHLSKQWRPTPCQRQSTVHLLSARSTSLQRPENRGEQCTCDRRQRKVTHPPVRVPHLPPDYAAAVTALRWHVGYFDGKVGHMTSATVAGQRDVRSAQARLSTAIVCGHDWTFASANFDRRRSSKRLTVRVCVRVDIHNS